MSITEYTQKASELGISEMFSGLLSEDVSEAVIKRFFDAWEADVIDESDSIKTIMMICRGGDSRLSDPVGKTPTAWLKNYSIIADEWPATTVLAIPTVASVGWNDDSQWCWLSFGERIRVRVESESVLADDLGIAWSGRRVILPSGVVMRLRGSLGVLESGHLTLSDCQSTDDHNDVADQIKSAWSSATLKSEAIEEEEVCDD
jgi:hypothetical protein